LNNLVPQSNISQVNPPEVVQQVPQEQVILPTSSVSQVTVPSAAIALIELPTAQVQETLF
jgi:hypothetical protein